VISLNLVLAGLRLGLKNYQVGEKWVADDCSYLCKGQKMEKIAINPQRLKWCCETLGITVSSLFQDVKISEATLNN
jgi:hypothetical protein